MPTSDLAAHRIGLHPQQTALTVNAMPQCPDAVMLSRKPQGWATAERGLHLMQYCPPDVQFFALPLFIAAGTGLRVPVRDGSTHRSLPPNDAAILRQSTRIEGALRSRSNHSED